MRDINVSQTKHVVSFLANRMDGFREDLAALDALTGDGDMGVTIALIFRAMKKVSNDTIGMSISDIFEKMGEQVGETAPSTFGTLMATMLKSMSIPTSDAETYTTLHFSNGLSAAVNSVMRRGGAKPGDKTLLDALSPAADAAGMAAAQGVDLAKAAEMAAAAARLGAESTASMKAVTGRAGYMGDRSIGSKDPGAEAIALMLEAFAFYLCVD